MDATATPAFPLGSPLLPGMALPLRIFEPRYVAMVTRLLAADDPSFAVVLITRGHEVGGGEERSTTGCMARIVEAAEHPGHRWSLLAVGTERVRIARWLDDDPYPRAVVEPWPDPPVSYDGNDGNDGNGIEDRIDQLELQVLELVSLATEVGLPRPELDGTFSADPTARVYQFATICPIGAHDRHRLLCCPGLRERIELLDELVDEQQLLLRARRELGGGEGRSG